jgi:hypothetical protein
MRKPLMIICLSVMFLMTMGACRINRPLINCEMYNEAIDPSPETTADWESVESGLHASIGSIDKHYFLSSVPQVALQNKRSGTAWRGEKVSAQLFLWSRDL